MLANTAVGPFSVPTRPVLAKCPPAQPDNHDDKGPWLTNQLARGE
jgi:hypothetical protein